MTTITITMAQAKPLVQDVLRAGLVPMLVSSPGIGKSDLGREIASDYMLKYVDVRLSTVDPNDLSGFAMILNPKAEQNRIKGGYVPMDMFPVEGDPLPDGKSGWLINMDELNSAPQLIQAAAYKVILDKEVGMRKLHKKVAVMGAGNLATDRAIVNRLSTAMQSRLIHFHIVCCDAAWMLWADRSNVDHRVKAFIKFQPDLLHKFDPNHTDVTFPCPRTWEFTSKIIKPWEKKIEAVKLPALAGAVGEGAARQFFSFCQIFEKIPTLEQILADPEKVTFGENEPSMCYALAGMIGHKMTLANADPLVKFISRMGIDFQVATLRSAIARTPRIKKSKNVCAWIASNTKEFLSED